MGSPPPVKLPRILAIDDEPSFTRLLKLNLEATGRYVVEVETDPAQAVKTALAFRPNLILLDVMMPGIDGGDLVNLLCRNDVLRKVPVIFLTATVRRVEVDASHGIIGGYRFLSKPIALPELLECLDDHFEDHPVAVRAHC